MKRFIFLYFLLTLAACSSIKVSYDYDNQANFSNYKTYAYSDDAKTLGVNDLIRNRIHNAIDTEMAAKGFTKSDSPDVLIDLQLKAEKKVDATATTTGPGYGYGYGRYGWGGGFSTTSINYNEYVEGTLFVNMVDASTEKIVWQGRGTKTIDEDASPEKRDQNISYGIKQIFTKYPPK